MLARWSTYDTTAALRFPAAIDRTKHKLGRKRPVATLEPRVHDMVPELGLRLDAQPRTVGQLEKPVGATHPRLHEAEIGIADRQLIFVVRDLPVGICAVMACGN